MTAKRSRRLKPLSLYPLKLTDALMAALATPPPGRRKAAKRKARKG